MVFSKNIEPAGNEFSFDSSGLQNGLYLLQLQNGEIRFQIKLVVQK
jgi:hypothetical protein